MIFSREKSNQSLDSFQTLRVEKNRRFVSSEREKSNQSLDSFQTLRVEKNRRFVSSSVATNKEAE